MNLSENKKRAAEWFLDEKYQIIQNHAYEKYNDEYPKKSDIAYYDGALKMLEVLGMNYELVDGKHKISSN